MPFPTSADRFHRALPWTGLALSAVLLLAYSNSFTLPFVFDDIPNILENPSIRRLWPLTDVLSPSIDRGQTVAGRPLVNLSLAINYALSGESVWSYHGFNFLVHGCAVFLLFGIVRRTLQQPPLMGKYGSLAGSLGLTVAAIWGLHPLQTESVTYLIQRAESMVGLFYLLTLYCFIRGAKPGGTCWLVLSVGACLGGMATKEVMAGAPLLVLLYDCTFVAGTLRAAWRARAAYYLGLAGTWALLAVLVLDTQGRGGTAGFGTAVSSWSYLLTQCRALGNYLWLAIWPARLTFDYGTGTVPGLAQVWPQAMLLVVLLGATGWAVWRRPAWGFLGACFFVILAPSSSVIPIASQTMAEHRMYLPLAALVVGAVIALHHLAGPRCLYLCTGLALAGGWQTFQRNGDYRSELVLWSDTVRKFPENARAHNNLGKALFALGQYQEATTEFRQSIDLDRAAPEPPSNLGLTLVRLGRLPEAVAAVQTALQLQPDYAEARNNLGNAWLASGRTVEACEEFARAIRLRPSWAEARNNYCVALLEAGRPTEAIAQGEEALRLQPVYPEAHFNLGNALVQARQLPRAADHFQQALLLNPRYASGHNNLGNVLLELNRPTEAIKHYRRALELVPDYIDPCRNLAYLLAQLGRRSEAIAQFELLLRLRPEDGDARAALAELRAADERSRH